MVEVHTGKKTKRCLLQKNHHIIRSLSNFPLSMFCCFLGYVGGVFGHLLLSMVEDIVQCECMIRNTQTRVGISTKLRCTNYHALLFLKKSANFHLVEIGKILVGRIGQYFV